MKALLSAALATGFVFAPVGRAQNAAPAQSAPAPKAATEQNHANAFYYFTLGHVEEQEFDLTGDSSQATASIESYKKALEIEPDSAVILERLAEIDAKSQHIRDAVSEAQQALQLDPDNVDAHRLLARIYVQVMGDVSAGEVQPENLAKAIEQFEAILKIDPDDSYSAEWLARLYGFENQHEDAEKVLRTALQRHPDDEQLLEQLSQLLIDEGRSQEAVNLLSQATGEGAAPETYELLGDAYSQTKDYAKAEQAYRKAVEADPDDPGHRHGLAQALVAQDKYAEALEQYKKLAEMEPGTADNYVRMAQMYRHLRQYDDAESSLQRAKQLAPGSAEILYNEALLDEDQDRYDDAVKVLTDAIAGIKSQPDEESSAALSMLYEELGRAYRGQQNYAAAITAFGEMGKFGPDSQKRAELLTIDTYRESRDIDHAIAEAKQALDRSPKDATLTVTLAMLYGEKSDTASAKKLLQGLLKGNTSDQEIYVDIAQVEELGRQYGEAEQAAAKAEQMASDSSGKEAAWFMLGAIYERQKKYDQAEQQFRKVLDVNPNNASALNYFGYMLADRGVRLEEATSLIQQAVKQDPNNGAFLDSLGWAYYKQNKLAEAEEYLRKAADRERHDPTILGHLGNVYMKLGQDERAADLLERSLAEWQKELPADYEVDKVSETDAQLKNLKSRLAQKSNPGTGKPQ